MDAGTLLFALILLSAGIWLIHSIGGDFKEKSRQGQRFADVSNRKPQVERRAAPVSPNGLEKASYTPVAAMKIEVPKTSTAGLEQLETADRVQGLNASFVREKFERFQREL